MKNLYRNLMAFALCLVAVSLTACSDLPSGSSTSTPSSSTGDSQPVVDQSGYVNLRDPLTEPGAPVGQACDARNFLIVLDGSGSMAGAPLEQAKQAIHAYVNSLPAGRKINLGLVAFENDQIETKVTFDSPAATNRAAFLQAVDSVDANGGTPLAEAISAGTDVLLKQCQLQLNYGDYRMIVVTDGEATGSMSLDDACTKLSSYGFSLYTIGFNINSDHALKKWATSYETADSADSLAKKLQNTAAEPDAYVPPTYTPTK